MGYGLSGTTSRGGNSRGRQSAKGSKATSPNNVTKHDVVRREAKLYAELARELEDKLTKRNAEIMALRRSNKVLQQECSGNRLKISNLESQCLSRSEKVAQLSDTIATQKSNKVHERLMEKSLEIADLAEETERLKIQKKNLQENQSRNGKLLLEMSEIIRMLKMIDIEYVKVGDEDNNGFDSDSFNANSQYSDFTPTPSEDLPQDIPLENIRRKIRAIDKALAEGIEIEKENNLQKSKLEFLRQDNANLNVQIASLEVKIREQEEQLKAQEQRRNQSIQTGTSTSTDTHNSDYTFRTVSYSDESSKEVSYEEFVVDNGRSDSDSKDASDASEDTGIIDSYRVGDADDRDPLFTDVDRSLSTVDECNDDVSDNSSFSSLESPPSQDERDATKKSSQDKKNKVGIPPEEHKQLQNNFEKALDVIEKLKGDLSRHENSILAPDSPDNPLKEDLEKTSKEASRLEHKLEETVNKYEELKEEYHVLHDRLDNELETSKRIRIDLEATYKEKLDSLDRASKEDIEELTTRNKHLENQYNDLETEYSLKIESLQEKLIEMKNSSKTKKEDSFNRVDTLEQELKEHRQEMKRFQKEYDAMESVQQERVDTLLKEHSERMEEEKKKYNDLRYEYDTFLEIHLKLEEETEKARNHYKDSLVKIRNLESEAKKSQDTSEKTEANHKEIIENTKATHQEAMQKTKSAHQKELKTKESMILEWKTKFTKLKRDHVSAVKSHNEATQKFIAEIKEIKKDHGAAMAKQGRLRQSDAAKYKKLRREFDMSLVDYGKKEQITIHKYEESRSEYEAKMQAYERKIGEFQKLLSFSKGGDNKTLQEKMKCLESEAEKKIQILQAEVTETSKCVETEANQQFLKAHAESMENIDRLMEINRKLQDQATKQEEELEKQRKDRDVATLNYKELATSYQASLQKIESLIQHRKEIIHQAEDITKDEYEKPTKSKGGTVMERIKQLEKKKSMKTNSTLNELKQDVKKNLRPIKSVIQDLEKKTGTQLLQPKSVLENASLENTSHQSGSDPGFERDFEMIVSKVGIGLSPLESNLEVASVVSSVGSSITGGSILEALNKRAELYARRTGVSQDNRPQFSIANAFERPNLYVILRHFMQWKEVNSNIKRLPRFQKENESDANAEDCMSRTAEVTGISRIISNLLLHKKYFDGVQNSITRQNIVTQFDELSPSRLIELFPSEYNTSRESISSSEGRFLTSCNSALNEVEDKSIFADQISVGSNGTSASVRMAHLELERLQGEHFSMQLNMNTEEFKFKTREKKMRLLDLKYQNLRQEFEELKMEKSSVESRAMHETKEIDNLQKKVLVAELTAELTKREIKQHKIHINEARRDQEENNHNLKTVMSTLCDLEDFEYNDQEKHDEDIFPPGHENQDSHEDDHYNESNDLNNGRAESDDSEDYNFHQICTSSLEPQDGEPSSFGFESKGTGEETDCPTTVHEDGSDLEESHSLDALEGKPKSFDSRTRETVAETIGQSTVYYDDSEDGSDGDNSNDDGSDTINSIEANLDTSANSIQIELLKAKEAAEAARRKQLEREQNLRDVIFQYKKLQKEHEEALAAKKQNSSGGVMKKNGVVPNQKLVGELRQAQANVSAMKKELTAASGKYSEEKEQMQNVKSQFQSLQVDFLKILAEKQELEKAVYQQRPGLASGVVPAARNDHHGTKPQPHFNPSNGSRMIANATGGPAMVERTAASTRPKSSRPAPDGAPSNGAAALPQRPRTNTSPRNTSGSNKRVNSQTIVQLCERDRVPSDGPIRATGYSETVPTSISTSKLPQTVQTQPRPKPKPNPNPNPNPNRLTGTPVQNHTILTDTGQLQQPHQQQKVPGSRPQANSQQQPNWQQQKVNPRLDQKHPSKIQQPKEKLSPPSMQQQQQHQHPQPATRKKLGIFRGWRQGKSRSTAAATTKQKQ